jgi:hypothetical protein
MASGMGGADPGTCGGLPPVLHRALKKKAVEVTLADLQQWHKQMPVFTYDQVDKDLMQIWKESMSLNQWEQEWLNHPNHSNGKIGKGSGALHNYRDIEQNAKDANLHNRLIDQWYTDGREN